MLASFARPSSSSVLSVVFGDGPASPGSLRVATPWLAGEAREELFPGARPLPSDGVPLYQCGGFLLGHLQERFVPGELSAQTEALYRRILRACGPRHLVRVWNYVPDINGMTAGLEHYRAFCQGRARGFEAELGSGFERRLPAASAVGSAGATLTVLFVAAETVPTHLENPEQVPAYQYPPEHGPRSPSFARATVVHDGLQRVTFISGTAAIKGHETVAPGDLRRQLDCTLDNLRLIGTTAGLGPDLAAGDAARRHFKVYLRHPEDLPTARQRVESALVRGGDAATYLQADICRAALDVEIEATVIQLAPSARA